MKVLDAPVTTVANLLCTFEDGTEDDIDGINGFVWNIPFQRIVSCELFFIVDDGSGLPANWGVFSVEYFKDDVLVGSNVFENRNCPLSHLKYKVEMPVGAKVNLFEDGFGEVSEMSWNIPAPSSIKSMTFMQATSTNGMIKQETAHAGEETFDLYRILGRRNAIAAEIWSYQYAQTLWVASCKCRMADASIKDCIPTAGEGGTIVTALPQ